MFTKKNVFTVLLTLLCVAICVASFYGGFCYARKDVIVFYNGKFMEIFPKTDPEYCLPLREFATVKFYLKNKEYDKAKSFLRSLIEKNIVVAEAKLLLADEKYRWMLVNAINSGNDTLKETISEENFNNEE